MDTADRIAGTTIAVIFIMVVAGAISCCIYSMRLRAECVAQNAQRSAGDVIAICGKP